MPVSKKRKKGGKPVHRKIVAPEAGESHPHGPEAVPAPGSPARMTGKPSNPFVAQQTRRASQRGR